MKKEQSLQEYRRRIYLAMDHITHHLDENLSLDEIARVSHFSKFHFHRLFKMIVGETLAEFTRRLRIEQSMHFLQYFPEYDITRVAMECGFSSSQKFATLFKQQAGMTPTEFRKNQVAFNVRKNRNATNRKWSYDVTQIELTNLQLDRNNQMNVEVKELPSHHVAFVRHIGPYEMEGCGQAFGTLMEWAGPKGFANNKSIGVCWDNPDVTPAEKCRYDACVEVPKETEISGNVSAQEIAGGLYAVYKTEVIDNQFDVMWNQFFLEWFPQSGYQPAKGPAYEVYLTDGSTDPEGKWDVELCVPVLPL